MSVIELPLEHHTDSPGGGDATGSAGGGDSPITVQVTEDGDSIGQQQQVTAQVALVQSDSPNSAGQHYFTVTGEWGREAQRGTGEKRERLRKRIL